MVKIPSLSRRREAAPTRDENRDGVIDGRDEQLAQDRTVAGRDAAGVTPTDPAVADPEPVVTDRGAEQTTYGSSAAADPDGPTERTDVRTASERRAAERAATARAATTRSQSDTGAHPVITDRTRTTGAVDPDAFDRDGVTDPDRITRPDPEPEVVVHRGPRPRTSLLATLSLILGVAAALFVLTGTLAGYGMVLGGLGALLGVAGLSATRRRHVAGTSDAMIGLILGLGALVLGILAMTGQFGWPSTTGDWVQRFREWLDTQFVKRF